MERNFSILFEKLEEELKKDDFNIQLHLEESQIVDKEIIELKEIYDNLSDEPEYDVLTNS